MRMLLIRKRPYSDLSSYSYHVDWPPEQKKIPYRFNSALLLNPQCSTIVLLLLLLLYQLLK